METDVNEDIKKLKAEGRSLREIASVLGVSHVAVLKRLRAVKAKRRPVTNGVTEGLPSETGERSDVSTSSKAHKLRVSKEPEDTVNQLVTGKTPSVTISQGVNPFKTTSQKPTEGEKGVSPRVFPEIDDLFGAIKGFLESTGIGVYRMQVEQEAYQVDRNGQIVRFYVQRKIGEDKAKEETEEQG